MPRRLVPLRRAADHFGVSDQTIRNWIRRGHFAAYRVRGLRALHVDLDEATRALSKLPRTVVRPYGGGYGPDATIVTVTPERVAR